MLGYYTMPVFRALIFLIISHLPCLKYCLTWRKNLKRLLLTSYKYISRCKVMLHVSEVKAEPVQDHNEEEENFLNCKV